MSNNLRFKKLRLWVSYPFSGVYLVFAYKYGINFKPGIWLVLAGLLLRFWAAGYIRKIRELSVCGPYSFVRNPLYLGNFLIGLGFCLFVENIVLSTIYIVLFFLFYSGTMKKEEIVLADLFGKDYIKYKKVVPAIIPRFYPYKSGHKTKYSFKQAHYNGELIRVLVAAILLCVLYLFEYSLRQKTLNLTNTWLLAIIVCLEALLLRGTIAHRKKYIKQQDEK